MVVRRATAPQIIDLLGVRDLDRATTGLWLGGKVRLSAAGPSYNPLRVFVKKSQPWGRVRAPLPLRLTCVLWMLIPIEIAWAIWLVTVVIEKTACDGLICAVATLGHPAVVLASTVGCIVCLLGLVPFTRGLSQCNGPQVAAVAIAAPLGSVALLGIVAVVIGLILLAAITVIFVAGLFFVFSKTS